MTEARRWVGATPAQRDEIWGSFDAAQRRHFAGVWTALGYGTSFAADGRPVVTAKAKATQWVMIGGILLLIFVMASSACPRHW